ncbi:MAG: RbsD/FucU domain-containing protein [Polaromonas sp.]|jgi:L-fucose mutarotase|uniref:RbsD/FucU family protein n=2 Tax=Polaromonas sp. TaxID=1869339 RepID=UPI001DD4340C|nr:RbsD/FucU domain-containing protein [Polaromonas sp.]MBT9475800.1 RbsD or FucU transport [Polaromonas sp.]MDP3707079.1 RbsD/FucU domain-containing protein [Polaromonas sp.]
MLKGIDPLITPELLKLLMEMGHDEALLLADANFTAMSLGAGKPVLRLPGASMAQVVKAINALLPLAADVAHPVAFMQVSDTAPPYLSALQREVLDLLQDSLLPHQKAEPVERYAFYERVRNACAIVVTGELQPFGNFILRKGVIGETLRP